MDLNKQNDEKVLTEGQARGCPFCGAQPTIQKWHGGGPRKRLIRCPNEDCFVQPSVCGNTRIIAITKWNVRVVFAV